LDRNAQVRLSTFFIGLLSELWLNQNEYYINASTFEPTLVGPFEAPSADLLRMAIITQKHILSMDMEAMCWSSLGGRGDITLSSDASLFDPLDVVRKAAYASFRAPLYRTLRLLFEFDLPEIPVRLMYDLWTNWLQPWMFIGPADGVELQDAW
jgi:hypothetical protein